MEHPAYFRNSILMRGLLILWAAALFIIGSTNALRAGDLSDSELKAARRLYIAKCAKCHKLHDPAGYTDSEWTSWMAKMAKKARLKKDQEEELSRYLETMRKPAVKATRPCPPIQ